MTVKELREIVNNLPDNTKVILTKDEEWNEVRECNGFNFADYMWSKEDREIYEVEGLDSEGIEELESCLILC